MNIPYDKLEEALVEVALNPTTKVIKDDKGNAVQEHPADPNLIKELLGERIGGPQDWC